MPSFLSTGGGSELYVCLMSVSPRIEAVTGGVCGGTCDSCDSDGRALGSGVRGCEKLCPVGIDGLGLPDACSSFRRALVRIA